MKTHIKDISKTKKKLKLEVPAEGVDAAFQASVKEVGKKANLKGFRKGKVPVPIVEKFYAEEIFRQSLNTIVNDSYIQALQEHELTPVLEPRFDLGKMERGKKYSYEVEVEVKPKFDLKEYTGIPIKKREAKIADAAVDAELRRIQESRAELKAVGEGETLLEGLVATIDFEGVIDGKPFQGGKAEGHQVEIGRGQLLPEFEGPLRGMKIGEERMVTIKFPEDYQAVELREKEAIFQVKLTGLHTKELPVIDDEFAKDLGKQDLETVKKEITEMLVKREEKKFKDDYIREILEYLVKNHKFDVPEGLIQKELEANKDQNKKDLEERYRRQFILEAIARKESIQITPEELDQHLHTLSHVYRQPIGEIRKHFSDQRMLSGLLMQLVVTKTLDFLVSKATLN